MSKGKSTPRSLTPSNYSMKSDSVRSSINIMKRSVLVDNTDLDGRSIGDNWWDDLSDHKKYETFFKSSASILPRNSPSDVVSPFPNWWQHVDREIKCIPFSRQRQQSPSSPSNCIVTPLLEVHHFKTKSHQYENTFDHCNGDSINRSLLQDTTLTDETPFKHPKSFESVFGTKLYEPLTDGCAENEAETSQSPVIAQKLLGRKIKKSRFLQKVNEKISDELEENSYVLDKTNMNIGRNEQTHVNSPTSVVNLEKPAYSLVKSSDSSISFPSLSSSFSHVHPPLVKKLHQNRFIKDYDTDEVQQSCAYSSKFSSNLSEVNSNSVNGKQNSKKDSLAISTTSIEKCLSPVCIQKEPQKSKFLPKKASIFCEKLDEASSWDSQNDYSNVSLPQEPAFSVSKGIVTSVLTNELLNQRNKLNEISLQNTSDLNRMASGRKRKCSMLYEKKENVRNSMHSAVPKNSNILLTNKFQSEITEGKSSLSSANSTVAFSPKVNSDDESFLSDMKESESSSVVGVVNGDTHPQNKSHLNRFLLELNEAESEESSADNNTSEMELEQNKLFNVVDEEKSELSFSNCTSHRSLSRPKINLSKNRFLSILLENGIKESISSNDALSRNLTQPHSPSFKTISKSELREKNNPKNCVTIKSTRKSNLNKVGGKHREKETTYLIQRNIQNERNKIQRSIIEHKQSNIKTPENMEQLIPRLLDDVQQYSTYPVVNSGENSNKYMLESFIEFSDSAQNSDMKHLEEIGFKNRQTQSPISQKQVSRVHEHHFNVRNDGITENQQIFVDQRESSKNRGKSFSSRNKNSQNEFLRNLDDKKQLADDLDSSPSNLKARSQSKIISQKMSNSIHKYLLGEESKKKSDVESRKRKTNSLIVAEIPASRLHEEDSCAKYDDNIENQPIFVDQRESINRKMSSSRNKNSKYEEDSSAKHDDHIINQPIFVDQRESRNSSKMSSSRNKNSKNKFLSNLEEKKQLAEVLESSPSNLQPRSQRKMISQKMSNSIHKYLVEEESKKKSDVESRKRKRNSAILAKLPASWLYEEDSSVKNDNIENQPIFVDQRESSNSSKMSSSRNKNSTNKFPSDLEEKEQRAEVLHSSPSNLQARSQSQNISQKKSNSKVKSNVEKRKRNSPILAEIPASRLHKKDSSAKNDDDNTDNQPIFVDQMESSNSSQISSSRNNFRNSDNSEISNNSENDILSNLEQNKQPAEVLHSSHTNLLACSQSKAKSQQKSKSKHKYYLEEQCEGKSDSENKKRKAQSLMVTHKQIHDHGKDGYLENRLDNESSSLFRKKEETSASSRKKSSIQEVLRKQCVETENNNFEIQKCSKTTFCHKSIDKKAKPLSNKIHLTDYMDGSSLRSVINVDDKLEHHQVPPKRAERKKLSLPHAIRDLKTNKQETKDNKKVNPNLIINGKVYKPKRIKGPYWVNTRLCNVIRKAVCVKTGKEEIIFSNIEAVISKLISLVNKTVRHRKKGINPFIDDVVRHLYHSGLIKTAMDYMCFCMDYLPEQYIQKALRDTLLKGNNSGILGNKLCADLNL